ncbi:hypothetical protein LBMAG53_36130 [Planctomycetota bacterium]|nr:hypothetical protein LBMAG53_36130 [Planctomycetota bacterium]
MTDPHAVDAATHAAPASAEAPASAACVYGTYRDEGAFLHSVQSAVHAHLTVDAITPYPIHALDGILGLERSWIGRPVLTIALFGFATVFALIFANNMAIWPINVSGKPYDAWPLFIVCTLEAGLLFAAISNLLLAFHTAKLIPNPFTKVISERLTDDTFAVLLLSSDTTAGEAWLRAHGAESVALVQLKPGTAELAAELPSEVAHA